MLPSYRIETSQLIFSANQQTGFYMMGTLVVKVLRKNSRNIPISWLSLNQARYIFHNKPGIWFLNFAFKNHFYFSPFITHSFLATRVRSWLHHKYLREIFNIFLKNFSFNQVSEWKFHVHLLKNHFVWYIN